jgi:hypothetical protein
MSKVLAALRTVFLVFIIGYTFRAMPFFWSAVPRTFDEQYSRCATSLGLVVRAAWIAIAWIALETAIGWWAATRKPRVAAPRAAPPAGRPPSGEPPPGEPPFAPPPHR